MAEGRYAKYVTNDPTVFSVFKEVTSPQFFIGGEKNLGGTPFIMGWSLLTQPFTMVPKSHKHDYDQIICFIGGNPIDIRNFDALVEFGLRGEEEIQTITSTLFVFVPKGLMHGSLYIKKVNKSIMFIDVVLAQGAAPAGGSLAGN